MSFVKNAWYVAGWASEFDQELKRVTMLGEHLAMYRTGPDSVAALQDRCPHRFLPLSKGKRIGDDIQCGYHGMTFDCSGKCVRIPGQETIPPGAGVRSYPVCQRNDIVWVWMGEPDLADTNLVFDLPQFHEVGWDAHQGDALHLQSNYLNVAENLVDPAHVSFVHPTTLGNASSEDVPVDVDITGEVLVAKRWIRDAPPVGFFQEFGGFTGNVDRWHYYYLHLPCTAVIDFGSADADRALAEDDRDSGVRIFALHFMTPVNERYTIDRWMHLRNTATNDNAVSEKMDGLFRIAFDEDKAILEAIQIEEDQAPDASSLRLGIDKAPTAYRRRIQQLVDSSS
jgi:vanillate O-demethylase monooxygenase subunit